MPRCIRLTLEKLFISSSPLYASARLIHHGKDQHALLFSHIDTSTMTESCVKCTLNTALHRSIASFFRPGLAHTHKIQTECQEVCAETKVSWSTFTLLHRAHLIIVLSFIEMTHNDCLKRLTHLQS